MVNRDTCRTQLGKLSGVPFFLTVPDLVFSGWVDELQRADDAAHVSRAVDFLVAMRILPHSAQAVADAVIECRIQQVPEARPDGGYCDRCRHGRPQGWIYEKRIVRGNPYEFSGRCKCQEGGWA